MEGSTAVVGLDTLAQEGHVLELVADEGARDLDLLAADHNNLLAHEELLGHNGGQASEKVALAVNDNGLNKNEKKRKEWHEINTQALIFPQKNKTACRSTFDCEQPKCANLPW